jgi:diguanylate cyclase (GGDEF)-like protein
VVTSQIVRRIPVNRRQWQLLRGFNVLFILGYLAYAYSLWREVPIAGDALITIVFFLGACFVLIISIMSLRSITALNRMIVLERDVITDHLTGIYNRRFLDRQISKEFARSERYGSPLSLLLLDIDHFKEVNDHCGHQIGDEVLREIAEQIRSAMRESDYVGRFGGEEYMVILSETNGPVAARLAEKLRQRFETTVLIPAMYCPTKKDIKRTVSIGVASYDQERHLRAAELVEDADTALYKAKDTGRNRIVVSAEIDTLHRVASARVVS